MLKNIIIIHHEYFWQVATLINQYKNNTLVNYIGDFIIKIYKTNDPKNQSIFSSDVIRELFNGNKIGKKTITCVIKLILEYLEKTLEDYSANFDKTHKGETSISRDGKMCRSNKTKKLKNKVFANLIIFEYEY